MTRDWWPAPAAAASEMTTKQLSVLAPGTYHLLSAC
jgi:hypothetical protein